MALTTSSSSGKRRATWIVSSRAKSPPTCRFRHRPSTSGHQSEDRQGTRPHGAADAARPRRRGDRVTRRAFITLIGGAAAWPLVARAQQAGKLPTIGFLAANPSIETQRVAAFVQRLRELGWIDGRNLAVEYRWAEG